MLFDYSYGCYPVDNPVIVSSSLQNGLSIAAFQMQFVGSELSNQIAQTIAILIDTYPNDSDLKAFWKRNKLPITLKQIEKVNVTGGHLPPPESRQRT